MANLYLIVRTDMASMNAGRVAAQCSHASNYFVKAAKEVIESIEDLDDPFVQNFNEWENETPFGCGTVIVLDGYSIEYINRILGDVENEYFTGIFVDPEYAVQDGDVTHLLKNVPTCAFAFQFGKDDPEKLRKFGLYGKND